MNGEQNRNMYVPGKGVRRAFYAMTGFAGAMLLVAAASTAKVYDIYSDFRAEIRNKERIQELYREASKLADLNTDGVTTKDEWKALFKEHGVHFDEENPDFSKENLEKITGNEDNE
ncbi:hypothetical protein GF371_02060 [Candidatus Woesearchaeota archaeon]|nr:hypothetical protein [Candidatus Woesearchaeota archaeon]